MDPYAGPVEEFAFALRQLRGSAGGPAYRELARRAKFSAAALASAAQGEQLPSLTVALAYAEACGGDREEWERRWRTAAAPVRAAESNGAGGGSPYLGLAGYEARDADRFFGRDRLVADLLAQMRQSRLVTVVGPSGSGKSSLLRAGLVPAVRDGLGPDGRPLVAVVLTPSADPTAALVRALAGALAGPSSEQCASAESLPPGDGVDLTDLAGQAGMAAGGGLLVVVDQFEEVFTLCGDVGERSRFIDLLLSARSPGSRVRVVLGLRGDFYGHCAGHRGLAEVLPSASVLVAPMTASELREVIVKPASREHVVVEPDLVATIIADAGDEPGMLPLVSHALLETWRRRRGKALTLHAYQSSGGVHGAIAQTAEAVHAAFSAGQREMVRRILLRLITVGEDAPAARRPLRRTDLPGLPDPLGASGPSEGRTGTTGDADLVLDRLADARLVTLDGDLVQLAHEAVIDSWPRLRHWLDSDREGLRIRQQLTEAAGAWRELDGDSGALYRGVRLATTSEWAGREGNSSGLTTAELSFLEASIAAGQAEQVAVRRRTRRLRALAAALTVLLIVAAGAGWVAVRQRQVADQRLSQAQSRDLAGQAHAAADSDLARAARLAVRAFRAAPTPEARGALLSIAATQRHSALLADPPARSSRWPSVPTGGCWPPAAKDR